MTVVRRCLLALVLLTAWAALVQLAPATSVGGTASIATVAHAAPDTDPADAREPATQWSAADRADVVSSDSPWKCPQVHASLATTPAAFPLAHQRLAVRHERPATLRPSHLLHIPLLI